MSLNSISGKKWIFKEFNNNDIKTISETFSLNEIVAKLLAIRKKNIDDINLFLNPKIKDLLPNPMQLKDMDAAVNRSYKSILENETIGIFGDYDVDGATSTALLARYFLLIKQKFNIYIPDRKNEGYGPNNKGFEYLIKKNSKVIFTVDCGTSSFDPIKFAQEKSVDVIVLDHHQSGIKLPNARAIVNPNRSDDTSGLNYLCAAGVCFVFLAGLNKKLRDSFWFKNNNINEPDLIEFLDLVSLGTVCDVVPLVGLNRAIVKQGLKILKKRSNLGLKTLYDICKISSQPTTYDLGFTLGPRINAGGRVGKASHGAELLLSDDPKRTYQIAQDLDQYNKERRTIESILSNQIGNQINNFSDDPVVVLSGKNWHEGIIGIVASRIKDKYNKPTILISVDGSLGKGSARSVLGFDIGAQIIKAVQLGILKKGGGHKMAGGFSIDNKNINKFKEFLIKNFKKSDAVINKNLSLYLDAIIAPSALNEDFYNNVNSLAPFGSGNNEPKFVIENLKVINSKIIGENHIRTILLGRDGHKFNGLAWNAISTPLENILTNKNKEYFNIAGKMKLNEWNGKKNIDFLIEDIALS